MFGIKKASKSGEQAHSGKKVSPFIAPEVADSNKDRYMQLAVDKRNWQVAWRITAAILAVSVTFNGYYMVSSKFVPYIVAVDKLGHIVSVGVADRANPIDWKRVVHSEMVEWVEGTRRVVSDQAAQKYFLRKSYARVEEGSPAKKSLDAFIKDTKPFESAARQTVDARVSYALPRDGSTYEIEWTETKIAPNGDKIGEERWKGVFTYKLVSADSEGAIRANGAGFYITEFKWSKVIS